MTEIRKELSNLTFEELLTLKEKLGTKEYNEAMFGFQKASGSSTSSKQRENQIKRDNKNRPREMSSKGRVPKVREIVPVRKDKQKVSKDPRFANDCGKLNEELWNTNYSFLREMAKDEQKNLKQRFKVDKTLDEEKKTKIRTYLQRLSNKEKTAAQKAEEEAKRRAAKKERLQQIAEGKKPYYMKKSTKKYVELAEKYDELKAKGKIESYLKKKRAKNASRDKKVMKL